MGPALGGFLSRFGLAVPIFLAAGLDLANLILVFFWLPESLTPECRSLMAQNKKPPFTLKALIETLRLPMVGPLLNTRFFFALAFTMITTIFPSYAFTKFGLNSQTTGYLLAYVGVLTVIVQLFLIGKLSARFSDKQLIFGGTALFGDLHDRLGICSECCDHHGSLYPNHNGGRGIQYHHQTPPSRNL